MSVTVRTVHEAAEMGLRVPGWAEEHPGVLLGHDEEGALLVYGMDRDEVVALAKAYD